MTSNGNTSVMWWRCRVIFARVFQLIIATTSCFLVMENAKTHLEDDALPSLLKWFQILDGFQRANTHYVLPAPRLFNLLSEIIVEPLSGYCTVYYRECLISILLLQVTVFALLMEACSFLNSLLFLSLLLNSIRKVPLFMVNFWLSSVACLLSWYLFSCVTGLDDMMFGKRRERKKRKKFPRERERPITDSVDSPLLEERPIRNFDESRTWITPTTKLFKLPIELEFAEENHNLDQNISSLSLGPRDPCGSKRKQIKGSWFVNDFPSREKREKPMSDKMSLIWPARFNMNGVVTKNKETKTSSRPPEMPEFSDDETLSKPVTRSGTIHRRKRKGIQRLPKSSTFRRCPNPLAITLFFSLFVNVCLLFYMKDSIRNSIFK